MSADKSINVCVIPMKGKQIGSFEVICQGTLLFSKLKLGYFPHTKSLATRVFSFLSDLKNGNDLSQYTLNESSPIKSRSIGSSLSSPMKKPQSSQFSRSGKRKNH